MNATTIEKMGFEAGLKRESVSKATRKQRVFDAGGTADDINAYATGYRRGIEQWGRANRDNIVAALAGRTLYRVTAEHCNGKSDLNDPTDGFEIWVAGNSEDEAEDAAILRLEELAEAQPEQNARGLANHAGNHDWWSSVAIIAETMTVDDAVGFGLVADWIEPAKTSA